jgi:biotin carboxylase
MNDGFRDPRRVVLLMRHTTYRAGAFLEAAAALRVAVTVASDRAQALASFNPDAHLVFDFADPRAAVRSIQAFARQHPVGAVLAADDDGVVPAAAAAETLGLAHHPETAVAAARSKLETRERFAGAGLPGPRFRAVSMDADPARVAHGIGYPCVVKPLGLSASRGVIRADDPTSFVAAFIRSARIAREADPALHVPGARERLLVEDFLPGREVALEGLVHAGYLRALALFDKPDPLDGPFFEETLYVTPSRHPADVQAAIVRAVQAAVDALGLAHGPVHAEVRLTPRGPLVLEVAPRSIGGLCSRALRFDQGLSLEALILRHALGEDVVGIERESGASGVLMIPIPHAGVLRGVEGLDQARMVPGVEDLRLTVPVGQTLVPLPEGSRYLGFVFARDDSAADVEAALREAHARLRFDIDGARATLRAPAAPSTEVLR